MPFNVYTNDACTAFCTFAIDKFHNNIIDYITNVVATCVPNSKFNKCDVCFWMEHVCFWEARVSSWSLFILGEQRETTSESSLWEYETNKSSVQASTEVL